MVYLEVCNVIRSACALFCATDLFPGNLIDLYFMMFTEVLMKDLARMLINVHKLFNCRVSFKMLS